MPEDDDNLLLGRRAIDRAASLRADANLIEANAIRVALIASQGSEARAAIMLGIGRDTLHTMLRHRSNLRWLATLASGLRAAAGGHAGGGNPNLRKAATQGVK